MRDKPAGTVRITCGEHILQTTLLPKLTPLLLEYPDIKVEFDVNYGFRDIVADRFDAGVRMGDTIDKDMIAVPIGPQLRMAIAASPAYFETHPIPKTPRDLLKHNCINMRMQTAGGPLCLGLRAAWQSIECASGWAAHLQHLAQHGGCGGGGVGYRFPA
jgi:DNA-binding transcriptional LysR family regulator